MERNCESCVKIREQRDLLVDKCRLQGIQIESLRNKYLEKFQMLYDSKQEIAMLQKMVNLEDKVTEKELNSCEEHYHVDDENMGNDCDNVEIKHEEDSPLEIQDYSNPEYADQKSGSETPQNFNLLLACGNTHFKQEPLDMELNSCEAHDYVDDEHMGNEQVKVEVKLEEDSPLDIQDYSNPEYPDQKSASETPQNFNLLSACGNARYKQENLNMGIVNADLAAEDCRCNDCRGKPKKIKRCSSAKRPTRTAQKGSRSYLMTICYWMMPHEKLGWKRCGLAFRTIAEMVDHCKQEHFKGTKKTGFTCHWKLCKRKRTPFTTKKHFMLHFRMHSGQKPFRCSNEGCGKSFAYLHMLTRHQQTHGFLGYPCGYPKCPKVFPSKSALMDHRGLRHGERREDWDDMHNLKCTVANCGKICRNSFVYSSHMEQHNAKKPFVCIFPGCKEGFFWKCLLDKHVAKHTMA